MRLSLRISRLCEFMRSSPFATPHQHEHSYKIHVHTSLGFIKYSSNFFICLTFIGIEVSPKSLLSLNAYSILMNKHLSIFNDVFQSLAINLKRVVGFFNRRRRKAIKFPSSAPALVLTRVSF